MNENEIDEIVFQILLRRMNKKKCYLRPITQEMVTRLFSATRNLLKKENILLELDGPLVIVGDLHGNVDDLIRIFEKLHYPPATRYLFLGDYIDRGAYGFEVITLLAALKVKFPQHIFLLRGNHETESLTQCYGFHDEMLAKYNEELYGEIISTFHELPICCIVGQRIFCVHGGLSPNLKRAEDIKKLKKPEEFPLTGIITDLVWSDPDYEVNGFEESHRGCGYLFGAKALEEFLQINDFDLMVRSHEMCDEGIAWPYVDDEKYADTCITIFSNTNYCGRGNAATVLCVTENLNVSIETFKFKVSEETSRNILLPYWLTKLIADKEKERTMKKALASQNATKQKAMPLSTIVNQNVSNKDPLKKPSQQQNSLQPTSKKSADPIRKYFD